MSGARTIVVVGATSGLGRRLADLLAEDEHRLVLVGRDPRRVADLRAALPSATVIGADVSTAAGVSAAAEQIASVADRVDTLVNNAGVMVPRRTVTTDGVEENFAVHHLAPFSLTGLLLPLLRGGDGRVVNVNSEGHRAALFGHGPIELDFDDLGCEREYDPFIAYSRSKLANLLFGYELQRRYPELTVVALHPGMLRTDLGRRFPRIRVAAMRAMAAPVAGGAAAVAALATAPTVRRGGYYDRETPVRSSAASYDTATAARLWEVTERLRAPSRITNAVKGSPTARR